MSWRVRLTTLTLSALLSVATINLSAPQLEYLNVRIRNFLVHGRFDKFVFSQSGIPEQISPKLGRYTSPFYVVHFGLLYSESCRNLVDDSSKNHWFKDQTLKFWYGSPPPPSRERFKAALDWLLENVDRETFGLAHFLYNFDWPYPGYPGNIIKAPWWSGLTDAYAIILLLRGYDCFGDLSYISLAEDLYTSVLTPISEGGSLIYWGGKPWIEEYVDPRASSEQFSRVLNGMIYAYFGVSALEQARGPGKDMSKALLASISGHIYDFDMGYWSYYDGMKNPANIKYHRINWALIEDPRIQPHIPDTLRRRWRMGVTFPILYLKYGPKTISYFHFLSELILMIVFYYYLFCGIMRCRHKSIGGINIIK